MFRTLSIDKAIGCKPNIIEEGILHLSNNQNDYSPKISGIVNELSSTDPLAPLCDRLNVWIKNKICVTEIWVSDVTTLVEDERNRDVQFKTELGQPIIEKVFSVAPKTFLESVELNIRNINTYIGESGDLESFKQEYLDFLNKHAGSRFLIDRISADIDHMENVCNVNQNSILGRNWYSTIQIPEWFSSFQSKRDTLDIEDYKIWDGFIKGVNYQRGSRSSLSGFNLDILSEEYEYSKLPYLRYFLNEPECVANAAKGYLYQQKLPFLKSLRDRYTQIFFPESVEIEQEENEQLKEAGIKLQWNGNNRALYDLFAQLTLLDAKPKNTGKTLLGNSIKEIARFLSDHVEGLPTVTTVERELEKMREREGMEKAKRGRIDIHITRDDT